jgi:hypothetical protein
MVQSVQLSIADSQYATTVREALAHSCAWHVESVESPDTSSHSVMVLDEQAFARLPLPLSNPGQVVLIARKDRHASDFLEQAWQAGIVSVVSDDDPLNTVLLAIMAAALRVAKPANSGDSSEIPPTSASKAASIAPVTGFSQLKRRKIQ